MRRLRRSREAISYQLSAISYQLFEFVMQSFRDLKVWRKGHHLTLEVYKVTALFPKDELYGITSQLRRACSSIPTNIAEGCGRGGDGDFGRFIHIAMGSASETEYLLLLARELNFLSIPDYERLQGDVTEVKRMIASLI